jgi:hypothetical protein
MVHDPRVLLRLAAGRAEQPTAVVLGSRTLQSTPESGGRVGNNGIKRHEGSKLHAAVDTLGHLLACHVTPADAQDRAHVAALAAAVQQATGETVELAYVDQDYTGACTRSDNREWLSEVDGHRWQQVRAARPAPTDRRTTPAACLRTAVRLPFHRASLAPRSVLAVGARPASPRPARPILR